jgi:acetylornithine aminotransferase
MPTYGRLSIALSHGQGTRVWDTEGRCYLDALGGIAVNTLGHNHPRLVAALRDQVGRLIHCCNYYHIPEQEALAARLTELSGLQNAFFCNSGLEANEGALKLARKFGHDQGIATPQVVVFEKAFHGRSLTTISATGNRKIQEGFAPLVPGFLCVPANDLGAIEAITAGRSDVVAVLLEPIQGEGGILPMEDDFLRNLRALCDARGWLLMLDEVQCGIARTGKWFAHQWAGVQPDVLTLAKGLGSGVPVGALLAGPRGARVLQAGNHGSTFGGNPLAMRASLTTLQVITDDALLEHVQRVGAYLRASLERDLAPHLASGRVRAIRGRGLILGIELDCPCGAMLQQAAEAGVLLSVTAESVIRLVPPLIFTEADANLLCQRLCPLIDRWLSA